VRLVVVCDGARVRQLLALVRDTKIAKVGELVIVVSARAYDNNQQSDNEQVIFHAVPPAST
jgi:hypothetical protein